MDSSQSSTSRREFVKTSGKSAVVSALANVAIPPVHAAVSDLIQIALVGCGRRGGVRTGRQSVVPSSWSLWPICSRNALRAT